MLCPYCLSQETKVVDKRDFQDITRRRRECLKCSRRFNTHEKVEKVDLRVIKKDGSRESFDLGKIKGGIVRACEKRPISTENINKMLTNIEGRIRKKGADIETNLIGDLVSRELKKSDKVAYIRFASVYRDFEDVDDFKREIKGLK
tara:strand:- start:964 stop:1401 length:438 start_codon:yes stop_codon:yes gene_type:complete